MEFDFLKEKTGFRNLTDDIGTQSKVSHIRKVIMEDIGV